MSKHYKAEWYYHRWMALYMHFSNKSFNIMKYPRTNPTNDINKSIFPKIERMVVAFHEDIIDEVVIANFVERFRKTKEPDNSWIFDLTIKEMQHNHSIWKNRVRNNSDVTTKELNLIIDIYNIPRGMTEDFVDYNEVNNIMSHEETFQRFINDEISPETIIIINKGLRELKKSPTFLDVWEERYSSKNSFPNFQKTFIFLRKYAIILENIELYPDY